MEREDIPGYMWSKPLGVFLETYLLRLSHGAQEETRTPKIVLLRHTRLPIASLELVGTTSG